MTAGPDVKFASGPAGPIAYRDIDGDGVPVVFVHGINMSSGVWSRVVPLREGRRRIVLDLHGHGRSHRNAPFEIDDYLADLESVIEAAGVDRSQVVGVSLGGMIACLYAQEHPERVQSVVAFGSAPSGKHPDLDGAMLRLHAVGVASYFEASLEKLTLPPGVDREVRDLVVSFAIDGREDPVMVEAVTRAGFTTDLSGRLHPSGRPVLIVNGELDSTCTPELGRALAEATGGRAREIPNGGHILPLETPEECAALIAGITREL
jgi:pimeloyl-ACP methyl ester carboxylesterase